MSDLALKFIVPYLKNRIILLIGWISIFFLINAVSLTRVYLGLHSWHQIIEGWCYGILLLCTFYSFEKKTIVKIKIFNINRILFKSSLSTKNNYQSTYFFSL